MKKLALLAIIAWTWSVPVLADTPPASGSKPQTIFDYKQQLNITDDQEKKMKAALNELQTAAKTANQNLNRLEGEYRKLISQDASIEKARAKLKEIAEAQVELRLADLRTSRKLTGVLKPEQMAKWKELQAKMKAEAAQKKP